MPEIHDTEGAPTEATPALAVSVKLSAEEVSKIDAWAKAQEAELRTKGLRMTVSRAAAIRSLIMQGVVAIPYPLPPHPTEEVDP